MMNNDIPVFAMYTDWNRKGGEGKYGGVGWYRILNPLRKIENITIFGKYSIGGETEKERTQVGEVISKIGKVMFMKYVDDWAPVAHLITIKRVFGLKLVIDIDDDLFNIHPDNIASKWHYPGSKKNEALKFFIKNADHLVVSTPPLASSMSQFGIPITVIPNTIDEAIWKPKKSTKEVILTEFDARYGEIRKVSPQKDRMIRIGWASSANHAQDVPVIKEAMRELLEKYDNIEFWIIGYPTDAFKDLGSRVRLILGTSGYAAYPMFLRNLNLDISIAPIIDDQFNRGKSNIKWMEASMLGLPTVASKVYPYENSIKHSETGFLARNTENWVFYLSKLIENKELRETMGKDAKKAVLKDYNVKNYLEDYTKLFEKINE